MTAQTNPHMWIPELGFPEDENGERCRLCGVLRAAKGQPEPPEAARPCPEPWPPSLPGSGGQLLACRSCGAENTADMWLFAGKFCPECGSNKGAALSQPL